MCNNSYSVYPECDNLDVVCEPDPFAPQTHQYDRFVGLYKLWGASEAGDSATPAADESNTDAAALLAGAAGGRFVLSTLPDWLLWAAIIAHIYTMRRGGAAGRGHGRYPASFRPRHRVWKPNPESHAVARLGSYVLHHASSLVIAAITEIHVLLRPGAPMKSIHWNFKPGERQKSGTDLYTATFFVQLFTFVILALTFEQGGSTFVQVRARAGRGTAPPYSRAAVLATGDSTKLHLWELRAGAVRAILVHGHRARCLSEPLVQAEVLHANGYIVLVAPCCT